MNQSSSSSGGNWRPRGRSDESTLLSEAIARAAAKTPSKTPQPTPSKNHRSLSDSIPVLSPSPRFKEPLGKANDDHALLQTPARQSSKLDATARGLSLQMPPRDLSYASPTITPSIEARDIYSSPSSVIPRHSRGLDFSRAATHLHHSTIAEQPSPDASPTITHKSLAQTSRRTSSHSMMLDSPRLSSGWMSSGNSYVDRATLFPRSIASTAINSDSSSSDSEIDAMEQDNPEEAMIATPQIKRLENSSAVTPFNLPHPKTSTAWNENNSSPVSSAYMGFRHGRRPRTRGRHSSDSTENGSKMTTPDQHMSISRETTLSGYFPRGDLMQMANSRRESLSLGTNHLHISSSNEDADESTSSGHRSGVIRRPVTKPRNLLPKTKTFARIRAALQEEGQPAESEAKRESEVVKQTFQHSTGPSWGPSTTAPPSPDLTPTIPAIPQDGSMSDIETLGLTTTTSNGAPWTSSSKVNTDFRRGSAQKEFWSSLYNNNRMQTPPPQFGNRARSSSGVSDVGMDSPNASTSAAIRKPSDSVSSQALAQALPTVAEMSRKVGSKRRRDDDFDLASMKRRAVSPGLSVQSSPVMSQSPSSNGGGWWGQPKPTRETSNGGTGTSGEEKTEAVRPNATPVLGPKKVGLQGMTDTSDGLMKMSID